MEKKDRLIREMVLRARDDEKFIVEGYASTYEEYTLFEIDNDKFIEVIDRNAFDNTDFSDCVFRVDHCGTVYARTSAGTVKCSADDTGLHMTADLSKTAAGRELYESIRSGNYPKMSFAFTANSEEWTDTETDGKHEYLRRVLAIDKVYDVSPVTWPANPTTYIDARAKTEIDGVIESRKLQAERLAKRAKLNLKLKLLEGE